MKCNTLIGNLSSPRLCGEDVKFMVRVIGTLVNPDINQSEFNGVCEKCFQGWLNRRESHLEIKTLP